MTTENPTHKAEVIDDGGPAFPTPGDDFIQNPNGVWGRRSEFGMEGYKGLSRRDYFAAAAMQGLLCMSDPNMGSLAREGVVRESLAIADAMISASKQSNPVEAAAGVTGEDEFDGWRVWQPTENEGDGTLWCTSADFGDKSWIFIPSKGEWLQSSVMKDEWYRDRNYTELTGSAFLEVMRTVPPELVDAARKGGAGMIGQKVTRFVTRDDPVITPKLRDIALDRTRVLKWPCLNTDHKPIESLMVSCYLQGLEDMATALARPKPPTDWSGGI